jgi:hypothetical protein
MIFIKVNIIFGVIRTKIVFKVRKQIINNEGGIFLILNEISVTVLLKND